MTEVITAVYEVSGDDPEARAAGAAVEQSHELPTALAPASALVSLARVVSVERSAGGPARATIAYPVELAGAELTQLLVVLLGNISLQDGLRLVDLDVPASLPAAWTRPHPAVAGIRRLVGAPTRPLLATALKPVGLSPEGLAAQAYAFAAGGIDIIKDDQGLANQVWAPFRERVAAVTDAVARANAEHGTSARYLPAVSGPGALFEERLRFARERGADGALVLPGISGYDRICVAREVFGADGILYAHPSFLGGFTAAGSHGIAPDVLFGLISRLAGADAAIFPSYGGRFSLTRVECERIAAASSRPFAGLAPVLPSPGGGMTVARADELVGVYGRDVLLLIGADLHRDGALRENTERFRETAERLG
ncbi:MAG: RuBisCO large subunit C-terminal-like domain-containing protein [Microbacterium sp.]